MNKAMLLKQYLSYHKKSSSRLPSAYQEVEYIESTGTQYIDSGLSINNPLSFKAEFKWRKTSTSTADQCLAGARYSTNYSIGYKGANCYNHGLELAPEFSSNVSFNDNIDYISVFEGGNSVTKYTQNGTTYTSSNPYNQFNTYGYNITLFAMNQGGNVQWFFIGRLYHYRFTINGTKVRDFIPCYRKSDNEVGLYDIVNNQFYTNQGTGTFLCGRPLVYDTIQGYQQVDYIETTGTQWIDTNYIPTIDDVIDAGIEFTSIAIKPVENWGTVFGAYPTKSLWLYKEMNGVPVYFCTYSGGSNVYKIMQVSTNIPYNIIFKKDTFIVNGISYSINNETRTSQDTLSLFRVNPYNASSYPLFTGKLRTFKVYKDNKYSINFIPMRRLSDNELGLYDLVNGVFYTNQGSGEFIAGEVLKA